MTSKRKPRCFVAMAFDHDDTDLLYDKSIEPVLKSNGIIPIIINRRVDNRDINQQIIEQLNECDFCLADLTYARPSVYFEAGYAQRSVEVIYTVKSDHLHKNQPDDQRVHFDLQMKPLIRWQNPEDKKFREKLERRLKGTFLKDWNRTRQAESRQRSQRSIFSQLALNERLKKIFSFSLKSLNQLKFTSWYPLFFPYLEITPLSYRQLILKLDNIHWGFSQHRQNRFLYVVSLRVEESLTLKKLRDEFGYLFVKSPYQPHLRGFRMVSEDKPINKTIEHHILCSIKKVPTTRIMSAMPSIRLDSETGCYKREIEWSYTGTRFRDTKDDRKSVAVKISVSRVINIHFIDNIQSLEEYIKAFKMITDRIGNNIS